MTRQFSSILLTCVPVLFSLAGLLFLYTNYGSPSATLKLYGGQGDPQRVDGQHDSPQIHLFIPMTRNAAMSNKRFCRGVESAIVNGWDPIIFNWDSEYAEPKKNKVYNWEALLYSPPHMANITENDLVFLMDGMDAWLQLSPGTLSRRYKEFGGEIVVGADKVLWPRDYPSNAVFPESPLPHGVYSANGIEDEEPRNSRPRYANSGTILGPMAAVRELLGDWSEIIAAPSYDHLGDDDQGGLNQLLTLGRVVVDYASRLFWVSAYDHDNVVWIGTSRDPDLPLGSADPGVSTDNITPWHLYPPLAHHKTTGEVPVVLHLNDVNHKHHLEEHWERNWWASGRDEFEVIVKSRLEKGIVRFVTDEGYREERFNDVCSLLRVD